MTGTRGVFTLRLLTLSLQQFVSYGSGFFPQAQVPMVVSLWGSLNFLCSPVSLPSLRGGSLPPLTDARAGLPFLYFFFFFNLHSPKLSYAIPWNFFIFFFFFCSQVCRRLTPWFWLSFSSKKPSWPSNLKQGLPAISSHYHFLFFRFLIKPDVILFIHLLFNHLSPTTSMWTPWEDKPYISCSPLIPSALKDRCMVDVKKHLFKNNS